MITVRFPNGQAVQYNEAVQVRKDHFGSGLYSDYDPQGRLIANSSGISGCDIRVDCALPHRESTD